MELLTQIVPGSSRNMSQQLEVLAKEGFSRVEIDGKIQRIEDVITSLRATTSRSNPDTNAGLLHSVRNDGINLLIDRLTASDDPQTISRLSDSVETAFFEGNGTCILRFYKRRSEDATPNAGESDVVTKEFSLRFEADGIQFEEPSDLMFNFNSPAGACPVCEGFGKTMGIAEELVIPDASLSVYDDAVFPWRGEKMNEWKNEFIRYAAKYDFPIHRSYFELTQAQKDLLWHGNSAVHGIDDFFKFVEENLYKIQYRVMFARYRGKTTCPACKGQRLKPQALYVKVDGKTITDLVMLPVNKLLDFFKNLQLNEHDAQVAKRLLTEIHSRLQFLNDVGLGYLTLDRLSATLSGGESQRINLATSLGSSLIGSLYVLDEPSIGLHSKDTDLLIKVLRQLQALGNTVVVVEHDEEIIRAADYIIDIGPDAGRKGGEVIYQGSLAGLSKSSLRATTSRSNPDTNAGLLYSVRNDAMSHTINYLTGKEKIEVPKHRRKWNHYIEVHNALENNLKNITVRFPLNVITVVTGVSGSGKSSLVRDVFYKGLKQYYDGSQSQLPNNFSDDLSMIKQVEFVDQNPIGRSSRSNPVTYIKAYDEIRKLFADQALAKQMRFTPAYFSFNVESGRCEECKGEGTITVEMQFMADVVLECEACHGKRFRNDVLDVEYRGKNIYDILEMTVEEAVAFFREKEDSQTKRIIKKLQTLLEVGLGYVQLGQSSSTLSGGENQRVKLAYHLSEERAQPTLFIFDEPTTGLHFHDIKTLMKAFDALIARGHTIVIIEHNLDVVKIADYVIDLGPEGGENGGYLIGEGTPEEIADNEQSFTGRFLKEKL
ncbi:UvrABC system protein A [Bacteroidia bacterium]|nr:UvrABC system protein A [Bacteroidia bacterium]